MHRCNVSHREIWSWRPHNWRALEDECAKYYLKLGTGVEEFSEFSLRVGECKGFQYHGFYSVLLTTIRNLGPQIAESLFLRSSKNGGHRNISVVFVVSARRKAPYLQWGPIVLIQFVSSAWEWSISLPIELPLKGLNSGLPVLRIFNFHNKDSSKGEGARRQLHYLDDEVRNAALWVNLWSD